MPVIFLNEYLHNTRYSQVQENRAFLSKIVKTIIFCDRQGIALRGHRDDGMIHFDDHEDKGNEGNFRSLLRLRVEAGDLVL